MNEFMLLDLHPSQLPAEGFFGCPGHYIYRYILNKTRPCERPLLLQAHIERTSCPATLKSRDSTLLLPLPTTGLGHVFLVPVLRVIPHLCWELLTWLRSSFSLSLFDKTINGHATSAAKLSPTRCHVFSLFPANRASPILRTTAEISTF